MHSKKIYILVGAMVASMVLMIFATIWVLQPQPTGNPSAAILAEAELLLPVAHTPAAEEPPQVPQLPPEPPPPPQIHNATLAFVGDIMGHIEQLQAARLSPGVYDFNYVFRYVSQYFDKADFSIGNLETTIVRPEVGFAGWPHFRSPIAFAEALQNAGISFLTTGNNHSFDAGAAGVIQTIEALNYLGIPYTGTFLTYEERDEITMVEINGITFALIALTYSTNAISLDANGRMIGDQTHWCRGEMNWMVKYIYHDRVGQSVIDYELIAGTIARARALEPDFVVILPHIGLEYYGTMNNPRDTFDAATDPRWYHWMRTINFMLKSGADIIMSSHPHTLLPAEFVYITEADGTTRRAFVAYSMANFVSAQRTRPREASAIFYLDFEKVEGERAVITGAHYVPIWVQGRDYTVFPVRHTLESVANGDNLGLRDNEIARIRQVQLDVTHMLSGTPIQEEDMEIKYEITRTRTLDEMPGRAIWGNLPWR
ncbi:MAG: CapA family protein [Defluviitaleaceae bacterium]|nr:CapA family protein [Defluviitaleaceae bacterium]